MNIVRYWSILVIFVLDPVLFPIADLSYSKKTDTMGENRNVSRTHKYSRVTVRVTTVATG